VPDVVEEPLPVAIPRWLRASLLVPIAIVAYAFALRAVELHNVPGPYWDEITYVADADAYLGSAPAHYRPGHPDPQIAEGTWMQPPLGKWMIAAGELVLGHGDIGFRSAAVVAGTAGVALVYLLGLELFGSVPAAATAAALLAIDGLHVVQSRMAMLDIFVSTFVLGAALFVARLRRGPGPPSPTFNGLLEKDEVRAGMLLGAAVAVKWSALAYLVVAAVAAWFITAARRKDWSTRRRLLSCGVAFGVLPLVTYLVAYTSFFVQHGLDVGGFLRLQRAMLDYGLHFRTNSTYQSSAWGWPFLLHPVEYAHDRFLQGGVRIVAGQVRVVRVIAVGNPVVWWGFLAAVPFLAIAVWRRRAWAPGFALAGYLAGWLPWLASGRTKFSYYLLPAIPFACLGLAGAIWAAPVRARRVLAGAVLVPAVVMAALYFPVWTGRPMSLDEYHRVAHLPGVRDAVKSDSE
jgi:dolichyl-phosphate-mannose--protein O-mannosyl transferase